MAVHLGLASDWVVFVAYEQTAPNLLKDKSICFIEQVCSRREKLHQVYKMPCDLAASGGLYNTAVVDEM